MGKNGHNVFPYLAYNTRKMSIVCKDGEFKLCKEQLDYLAKNTCLFHDPQPNAKYEFLDFNSRTIFAFMQELPTDKDELLELAKFAHFAHAQSVLDAVLSELIKFKPKMKDSEVLIIL